LGGCRCSAGFGDSLEFLQFHHRMNFPNSVARYVLSAVALIFGRMADVPKCLANNRDNRRFVQREFSLRPDYAVEISSALN
jgi:hypothetical protein